MFGSVLLMGSFASYVFCSNGSSKNVSCLQCQIAGLGCIFVNRYSWLVFGFHDFFRKNALVDLRCLGVKMVER